MIPVIGVEEQRIAVLGLGRSGLSAARALREGGAHPICWDDNEAARDIAAGEGISTLINCQGKKEFWTNAYPPAMPRHFAPGALAYYK